ncbi:MAG: arginine--tRNA ligase [Gemmatimonadota bacterium]
MSVEEQLRDALSAAARSLGAPADFLPHLERPRDASFGDWSSNAAMVLAKSLRRKPRDIAGDLVRSLELPAGLVHETAVEGAGFINFHLAVGAEAGALTALVAAGMSLGRTNEGGGRPVNLEFVSANPTGPLHVGHGRQAALGDAIAALLEWTGWKVTREFYYNDSGAQIANLALSVQSRIREAAGLSASLPEGGYHGEYIRDIAAGYVADNHDDAGGNDLDRIRVFAIDALRREQDLDLQAFGVRFDVYYLESSLYSDSKVEETVRMLAATGKTYEKDGALFLRTTDYGDDKDRVMRKSDGTYTYFVPDVAYHVTKWRRGFTRAINVQGADHHSTVTRVRVGLQALGIGIPEGYPEYELHQMVTVMRSGEEMKISKRAGSYVTIRDLIDEVGRDAVRYFLLMRKADSQLIFDIDLARTQSELNPVYYIQMAHARIKGIFRVGEIDPASVTGAGVDVSVLGEEDERELVRRLLDYARLVTAAAKTRSPHLVAAWLLETANVIHRWYHKHRVLDEPEPVRSARLLLARACQLVLASGLSLLGISAPERM